VDSIPIIIENIHLKRTKPPNQIANILSPPKIPPQEIDYYWLICFGTILAATLEINFF